MSEHKVHDHDLDPGCREDVCDDGLLRGECVQTFVIYEFTRGDDGSQQLMDVIRVKGSKLRDRILSEYAAEGVWAEAHRI